MANEKFLVEVNDGKIVSQVPYTPPVDKVEHSAWSYAPLGVGALLVILFCIFSVMSVKQQTVRVIQRFGKFKRLVSAGLSFKFPLIDVVAGEVDLKTQQLDVDAETKTKDNVFVSVRVSVQYNIIPEKVYDAFYRLTEPKRQIASYVLDNVRSKVPALSLDDLFEKKAEIATEIKISLKEIMDDFGYNIITALVVDIDPDEKVKKAMNEINEQSRLRLAANEKGEAEKILLVKKAEAEAESKKLQGEGIAMQRKAIMEGLKTSVEEFKGVDATIDTKEVMQLILLTQYFDTLREMTGSKVIMIPHSPSALKDFSAQIREAITSANELKD